MHNKLVKFILTVGVILYSLIITSCITKRYLETGTFMAYNTIENSDFTSAKYVVKEISKKQYSEANNINVLIDAASSNLNPKYLSIELYMYSIDTNQFELVTLSNISHMGGTPDQYTMYAYLKINEKEYKGFIIYDVGYMDVFNFSGVSIHESRKIIPGTYVTKENLLYNYSSKSKLILKEITKEESDQKSENIIKDDYRNIYLSIELYVFIDELNEYINASIKKLKHNADNCYIGEVSLSYNNELIERKIYITFDELTTVGIVDFLGQKLERLEE